MTPSDILRDTIYSYMNSIHTALPGIIVSYDHTENKAVVQPALNKAYKSGIQAMPLLNNVPIIFPPNIFFPIKEGDYVLLLFNERSIDLWKSVGGQVTPDDPRKFSLSDAVALVGLQPFTGDFSKNNGTDFIISFSGSTIKISPTGEIQIKTDSKVAIGNTNTELLNIVSQLMQLLQGASVTGTTLGGPLNPAFTSQVALIQAQLDAITGTIT